MGGRAIHRGARAARHSQEGKGGLLRALRVLVRRVSYRTDERGRTGLICGPMVDHCILARCWITDAYPAEQTFLEYFFVRGSPRRRWLQLSHRAARRAHRNGFLRRRASCSTPASSSACAAISHAPQAAAGHCTSSLAAARGGSRLDETCLTRRCWASRLSSCGACLCHFASTLNTLRRQHGPARAGTP